jgi:Leucine-rich repeat (LRR) protein
MISLTSLSLESNYKDKGGYFTWGIHGKLPTQLGKLKNLRHLHLNDNYLSGTLITEIGKLYFLETLHLQQNFLLGPIPSEYANCVLLEEILLENNNIDGSAFAMPEDICRLPQLDLARVDCDVSCTCCYGC